MQRQVERATHGIGVALGTGLDMASCMRMRDVSSVQRPGWVAPVTIPVHRVLRQRE